MHPPLHMLTFSLFHFQIIESIPTIIDIRIDRKTSFILDSKAIDPTLHETNIEFCCHAFCMTLVI